MKRKEKLTKYYMNDLRNNHDLIRFTASIINGEQPTKASVLAARLNGFLNEDGLTKVGRTAIEGVIECLKCEI